MLAGEPEIRVRPEPFHTTLKTTSLPKDVGAVLEIAPVNHSNESVWMILAASGDVFRFRADTSDCDQVGHSSLPAEPECSTSVPLRPRLHVSHRGEFAAVVNDYGHYGQVIDARTGKVTLDLDGGDYLPETVPLSFAFAEFGGRVFAIHRTAWNRLDFSDPAAGRLLSERGPTSYQSGEDRPDHYLDYFHGALHVNPSNTRILDDGWIWHPVGVPQTWSLERWFSENVWESEDGPSKKDICGRVYYWDHPMVWLNETTVAIAGIGDDRNVITDGACVFDVTASGKANSEWFAEWEWALEINAFAGPAGRFFTDGVSLFSSSPEGLSRWCVSDGARTGQLLDFEPTHHHRGAREFALVSGDGLTRVVVD